MRADTRGVDGYGAPAPRKKRKKKPLIERSYQDPVPGINWVQVTPDERKRLNSLIEHYRPMAHPFTACVRDNTKRFGKERAERICAVLKDLMHGGTDWRKGRKMADGSELVGIPEPFITHEELIEVLDQAEQLREFAYNPNQLRAPRGTLIGGRWIKGGDVGLSSGGSNAGGSTDGSPGAPIPQAPRRVDAYGGKVNHDKLVAAKVGSGPGSASDRRLRAKGEMTGGAGTGTKLTELERQLERAEEALRLAKSALEANRGGLNEAEWATSVRLREKRVQILRDNVRKARSELGGSRAGSDLAHAKASEVVASRPFRGIFPGI